MNNACILVAENSPEHMRASRRILEGEGFSVITAQNPEVALEILGSGRAQLAILDLRLRNDSDPEDDSGLEVARRAPPGIPKLILSSFPSYEAARAALGVGPSGRPAAVGFIDRSEGPEALLRAVRLALIPADPVLSQGIWKTFGATAGVELPERIRELGPDRASDNLRHFVDAQRSELAAQRERDVIRAVTYERSGNVASWLGLVLIAAAVAFVVMGSIPGSTASLVATIFTNVVRKLFSERERSANERVRASYSRLEEVYRISGMLELCASLESPSDRDRYRMEGARQYAFDYG